MRRFSGPFRIWERTQDVETGAPKKRPSHTPSLLRLLHFSQPEPTMTQVGLWMCRFEKTSLKSRWSWEWEAFGSKTIEGSPISLSPAKATFSAVVRTQLDVGSEGTQWERRRLGFHFLLMSFFHEHSVHLSFLTSMFSSGKFQGHGSEQIHLLPPFALWHFIATSQFEVLVRYPSSSLLGRIGVGIGMKFLHLWDQHEGMIRICYQEHISLPQRLSLLLKNT